MTSTTDTKDLGKRIADLEARLEFQDETIATLNDELVAHQQHLQVLEKKVALMMDRWREPEQNPGEDPPPPHY